MIRIFSERNMTLKTFAIVLNWLLYSQIDKDYEEWNIFRVRNGIILKHYEIVIRWMKNKTFVVIIEITEKRLSFYFRSKDKTQFKLLCNEDELISETVQRIAIGFS
jgi:hypothetical protein